MRSHIGDAELRFVVRKTMARCEAIKSGSAEVNGDAQCSGRDPMVVQGVGGG